ncbi:hypothetical protein KSP40_PGU019760 [Platanthera guangdongensis]|uniref:Uncharacterized protein n=1 Tax=Platanthera guangdongensis TaxID=2320717 RepID=A0ABR2LJ89_9ASPA
MRAARGKQGDMAPDGGRQTTIVSGFDKGRIPAGRRSSRTHDAIWAKMSAVRRAFDEAGQHPVASSEDGDVDLFSRWQQHPILLILENRIRKGEGDARSKHQLIKRRAAARTKAEKNVAKKSKSVLEKDLAIFGFFIALGRSSQAFLSSNGFTITENPLEGIIRYLIGGSVLFYPQLSSINSYQLYVEVVCEELEWVPFYGGDMSSIELIPENVAKQERISQEAAICHVLDVCSYWMTSFIKYSSCLENPSNIKATRFLSRGNRRNKDAVEHQRQQQTAPFYIEKEMNNFDKGDSSHDSLSINLRSFPVMGGEVSNANKKGQNSGDRLDNKPRGFWSFMIRNLSRTEPAMTELENACNILVSDGLSSPSVAVPSFPAVCRCSPFPDTSNPLAAAPPAPLASSLKPIHQRRPSIAPAWVYLCRSSSRKNYGIVSSSTPQAFDAQSRPLPQPTITAAGRRFSAITAATYHCLTDLAEAITSAAHLSDGATATHRDRRRHNSPSGPVLDGGQATRSSGHPHGARA